MSSLAATQADGYYVGTSYFDSGAYKKQSKNEWHRRQGNDRATSCSNNSSSNHDSQSPISPVVRFELPYSGRCVGCSAFIMRGTRYNATKIKTDETYFTTLIHEFRMKCRACQHCEFVIRTDPQARGFKYVEGIERKKGSVDEQMDETQTPAAHTTHPSTFKSTLEKLEQTKLGQRFAATEREQLELLQKVSRHTYEHDADGNARIRTLFRKDRRAQRVRLQQGQALGWREGMPLLEATVDEDICAKSTVFGNSKLGERQSWRSVNRRSMFAAGKKASSKRTDNKRRVDNNRKGSGIVRPEAAASAELEVKRRRRCRPEKIASIDLTNTTAPVDDATAAVPTKRKRITLRVQPRALQTLSVASAKIVPTALGRLMEGYGSDSD